jgi:Fe-S cluster assembly iron-binding protein IscA
VFVTGGGCSGFQYGFTFDEVTNEDDTVMEKNGVSLLIDPMSYQYLVGAEIDYTEGLEGSQFVIKNPNAPAPAVAVRPSRPDRASSKRRGKPACSAPFCFNCWGLVPRITAGRYAPGFAVRAPVTSGRFPASLFRVRQASQAKATASTQSAGCRENRCWQHGIPAQGCKPSHQGIVVRAAATDQ